MKLTQLKARTSARLLGGKKFPRQDRTSSHLEENRVEGKAARPNLDSVPRMKREGGGRAVLSEDSKAKAKALRDDASTDINKSIAGSLAGTLGGNLAMMRRKGPGIAGMALPAAGLGYMGKKITDSFKKGWEADSIERGEAVPGEEDRKSGGKVQKKAEGGPIGNPGRISDDSKNEASKLRGQARGHDASAVGSAGAALTTLLTRSMGASPGAGIVKRTLFSKPVADLATATNATMAADSLGDSRSKRRRADEIDAGVAESGKEDRKFGGRLTARKKGC